MLQLPIDLSVSNCLQRTVSEIMYYLLCIVVNRKAYDKIEWFHRQQAQLFSAIICRFFVSGKCNAHISEITKDKALTFFKRKQHISTYNSRHAGPFFNSSISINVQHFILIRFFFGLKCLNSKNIAAPKKNQFETFDTFSSNRS